MTINLPLYSFTNTVSTTEYSLTNDSTSIQSRTTVGAYQLLVDGISNMAALDEYEIALQEKVLSGGTQRRTVLGLLNGAQGEIWVSPTLILGVGWDFTLKRLAGSDRSLTWSVRSVSGTGVNEAVYAFTNTIGTTEYSCTADSTTLQNRTTDGTFQLFVDGVANLAAGDEFEVAVHEKAISGGTRRRSILGVIRGPVSELYVSPPIFLGEGWDFSIKKLAGTDRSMSWSVRGVT